MLAFAMAMIGCRRSEPIDEIFSWPRSGDTTADSLMLEFERARARALISPYASSPYPSDSLISYARHSKNPLVRFRAEYTRCCLAFGNGDFEKAGQIISHMETLIDSASHPYDWHMMQTLKSDLEPDLLKKHNLLIDNAEYFIQAGYDSELPRIYNNLGNLMTELNDSSQAQHYYSLASRLSEKMGLDYYHCTSLMNQAAVSPRQERTAMLRRILDDPIINDIPVIHTITYCNYFMDTDSVEYIDKAIEIDEIQTKSDITPLIYALKGDWLSRQGRHREGIQFILKGKEAIVEGKTQSPCIPEVYEKLAQAYDRAEMPDSASANWRRVLEWHERLDYKSQRPAIYHSLIRNQTKLERRNATLAMQRQWLIAAIIGILIILIVAKTYHIMHRRRKKIMDKLKQTRQLTLAQSSVIEENQTLITSIAGHLGQKDTVTTEEKAVIQLLKIHNSNDKNRKTLLDVQQHINPEFLIRLKKDYPALTENQLRLASLILAGADSRTIANIMNITQPSVHTSRYRLRMRLNLSRTDSLEAFLRQYNL